MKRLLLINLIISSLSAMQPGEYIYRQATNTDVKQLLKLVKAEEKTDSDRLVILPRLFRQSVFEQLVKNKRLFVAQKNDQCCCCPTLFGYRNLIGYKKLYLVTDEHEKRELLHDELRCNGVPVYAASVTVNNGEPVFTLCVGHAAADDSDYGVCIYDGSDFTLPAYRGKGINSELTDEAFPSLKSATVEQLEEREKQRKDRVVSLLYGLVRANAGENPGETGDRTRSLSSAFATFIRSIEPGADALSAEPVVLHHARYNAFMPTFDFDAKECKPLPDDHSIAGYGCVLTYKFRNQDGHKNA